MIDAGDQVVQLCHVHATGKGSGVTLDTAIAYLHTLRDGRPWGYVAQFQDPDGNRLQIREGR